VAVYAKRKQSTTSLIIRLIVQTDRVKLYEEYGTAERTNSAGDSASHHLEGPASGLSVNDYLAQLLELTNGHAK
jgi:hypothetical protein